MRVGIIIYGSLQTRSGGYLYDRKLVEYLERQGDTVQIISLPWRSYAAHLLDNLSFRLPDSQTAAGHQRLARAFEAAQSGQADFDILIQDELNHPSLILANLREHPYPVVSLVHHLRCSELRPRWQNAFYRRIETSYLRSVDGFIFNSQTTRDVVQRLIGADKPAVIGYPPTDTFGDPIAETEIIARADGEQLRILFVGNVIRRKGLHILLQAAKKLGPKVRVDIVGSLDSEPGYAGQMQAFVLKHDLSTFVRLHSALEGEALKAKLRSAHVLVVPSSFEGYGIVYLEGMGFGLPAIGTAAGAAREIISDGVDGFLVRPGDSDFLAGRLGTLQENRELLIRMSLAARQRYLRQPAWEETAPQIREFLHDFLG